MTGADLAREVCTPREYVVSPPDGTPVRYRVAAVDLGIKAATPRSMAALGCEVRVLPATATDLGVKACDLWDPETNLSAGTAYLARPGRRG